MRIHFSDGFLDADYELDFISSLYDVILMLHDTVMSSFLVCFYISKSTCVRIVGVARKDAEYTFFIRTSKF